MKEQHNLKVVFDYQARKVPAQTAAKLLGDGAPVLPVGCNLPEPDARSHAAVAALVARLAPGAQAGAHHCRPGRSGANPTRPPGGGIAVQAEDGCRVTYCIPNNRTDIPVLGDSI